MLQAIEYLEQATARDSDDARAHAALADAYALLPEYTGTPASEAYPDAMAAALRAVLIDPELADAHVALGVLHTRSWQWRNAEAALRRAIELNAESATAHHRYSLLLRILGRPREALDAILRAQELDPLSLVIGGNVVDSYAALGELDRALAEAQKMIELEPRSYLGHASIGLSYLRNGLGTEAIAPLEQAIALGATWLELASVGCAYGRAGRRSDAVRIIRRLEREWAGREQVGLALAIVYAGIGEHDRAFELLERDFQTHSGDLPHIRWGVPCISRSDPRYSDLIRRMALSTD